MDWPLLCVSRRLKNDRVIKMDEIVGKLFIILYIKQYIWPIFDGISVPCSSGKSRLGFLSNDFRGVLGGDP